VSAPIALELERESAKTWRQRERAAIEECFAAADDAGLVPLVGVALRIRRGSVRARLRHIEEVRGILTFNIYRENRPERLSAFIKERVQPKRSQ
jgi:hypothetical protein